jgi:hypothetical protein
MGVPQYLNLGSRRWAGRVAFDGLALLLAFGVVIWFVVATAKASLVRRHPAPRRLVNIGGQSDHDVPLEQPTWWLRPSGRCGMTRTDEPT